MATRAQAKRPLPPGVKPTISNMERANTADPHSYLGKIVKELNAIETRLISQNPDAKDNKGRIIGEIYLWDEIQKIAKSKSDALWDAAEAEGLLKYDDLSTGQHLVAQSPSFVVTASVSEPVRRFDPDTLAKWLFDNKKIPVIITKEQIERAKIPTKSQTRVAIIEKAGDK
jgi:hypothetical protein